MDDENIARIEGLYTRLRSQVEHENNLYNQRIVWLITMQAFLYATVGFLLQAKVADTAAKYAVQIDAFTALVCFLGMYVALISNKILSDARGALQVLRTVWNKQAANFPPSIADFYPHVSGGDGKATTAFFLRSRNLPALFAGSWIIGAPILLFPWLAPIWPPLNGLVSQGLALLK